MSSSDRKGRETMSEAAPKSKIQFVPMKRIFKMAQPRSNDKCSNWVATEKVHGSNFQFYTNDGQTFHMAGRRAVLDGQTSYQKCDISVLFERYKPHVSRAFDLIRAEDRWAVYRTWAEPLAELGADEDDNNVDLEKTGQPGGCTTEANALANKSNTAEKILKCATRKLSNAKGAEVLEVRFYGELYGGGGVVTGASSAVQKEIIYCDEYRFYAYGITVNRKWTTVAEMNDICERAGFPFYATTLCPPTPTLAELVELLTSSGVLTKRSTMTDRTDNFKTNMEGVVVTPLIRDDFGLHAVKILSSAFNDVRATGANKQLNYCTKARYLSVISKLDTHERQDTGLVTEMFIDDVLQDSGEQEMSNKQRKSTVKKVRAWLAADGYVSEHIRGSQSQGQPETHNLTILKPCWPFVATSYGIHITNCT
ncbi:unnamed protein product [Lymnaea stagnalis]|uniref:RNA ligase domain-containing protein n=1 Tax=Lymnaea stagnalis TaxID=6523 RepID=A0AAV2HV57_LYMST